MQNHPNLSNALKDNDGNPQRLNMSDQDKIDVVNFLKTLTDMNLTNIDVVNFLKTLTDMNLTNDEKFSNPFIDN